MKTIAIHQKDDWYLMKLPGLNHPKSERIAVEVSVTNDIANLDYDELRDIMVMERYLEKQSREINEPIPQELENKFVEKFNLSSIQSFDDVINHLNTKP
jgi:hypothetical protein